MRLPCDAKGNSQGEYNHAARDGRSLFEKKKREPCGIEGRFRAFLGPKPCAAGTKGRSRLLEKSNGDRDAAAAIVQIKPVLEITPRILLLSAPTRSKEFVDRYAGLDAMMEGMPPSVVR